MYKIFNKSIIHKIKSAFCIFLIMVIFMPFFSCKKMEASTYQLELYGVSVCGIEGESFDYVLTATNNSFNKTVGVYPFHYFFHCVNLKIRKYNGKNDEWGRIVADYKINGLESDLEGISVSYKIKDDDKIRDGRLSFMDYELDRSLKDNGYYSLEKTPGIHTFVYNIPEFPEYGITSTVFNVTYTVERDHRTEAAKIILKNESYDQYKIVNEIGDSFDTYIIPAKTAVFEVVDENTGKYILSSDGTFSQDGPHIFVTYEKVGIDGTDGYRSEQLPLTLGKGIYFCIVHFGRDEIYIPLSYYCYIIFI